MEIMIFLLGVLFGIVAVIMLKAVITKVIESVIDKDRDESRWSINKKDYSLIKTHLLPLFAFWEQMKFFSQYSQSTSFIPFLLNIPVLTCILLELAPRYLQVRVLYCLLLIIVLADQPIIKPIKKVPIYETIVGNIEIKIVNIVSIKSL